MESMLYRKYISFADLFICERMIEFDIHGRHMWFQSICEFKGSLTACV